MFTPVRQVAYFVADARASAAAHAREFGSGPFFVSEHVPLQKSLHRGVQRPHDHSSAYGQWGAVMVEFVQQHNPDPSAFHDMYPHGSGRYGFHHVAVFVEDVEAEIVRHAEAGRGIALHAELANGFVYAMIDMTETLGHMIELYQPVPALVGFYAMVAGAAVDWNGEDPVRTLVR